MTNGSSAGARKHRGRRAKRAEDVPRSVSARRKTIGSRNMGPEVCVQ